VLLVAGFTVDGAVESARCTYIYTRATARGIIINSNTIKFTTFSVANVHVSQDFEIVSFNTAITGPVLNKIQDYYEN
jgi:hypothetical protein